MIKQPHNPLCRQPLKPVFNHGFYQKGATLITVLVMLLLVTVIGTYAMSQGLMTLKLATNTQIQKLLMQNADAALNALEKDFATNQGVLLDATPIGQILMDGNEDYELQFCYKPSEINASDYSITNAGFFDLTAYRIVKRSSDSASTGVSPANAGDATKGYCDIDTMFSIGRKAVVTQIALSRPDDLANTTQKYQLAAKKTDLKENDTQVKRVKVTVTSLSPSLVGSSVSDTDLKACLSDHVMDGSNIINVADGTRKAIETTEQCLRRLGVPVNTQVSEYVVNFENSGSSL